MKHEDMAVATIAKEGAAEFSNICWCLHPARGLRIEAPKALQLSILFFRQQLNAHRSSHINSVAFGLVFFS